MITLTLIYLSQSAKKVFKSICFFYVGLLIFLFLVNWVFKKNPSFWDENNISKNYLDIFLKEKRVTTGFSSSIVRYGGFFGGKVFMEGGSVKVGNTASELLTAAQTSFSNKRFNTFTFVDYAGNIKYVGFFPEWYTVTSSQIFSSFNAANKLIMMVCLSSLLTVTTTMSDLAYALEDMFKPLQLFKLPAKEMALIIAIALRFTPSLLQESFRIIKAQASRGIDFKNGKFRDKSVALTSLFVPLFIIAFIKSDELSSAMIARSYKSKATRTSYRMHKINFWEMVLFTLITSFISFLYYFHFNNFYFGFASTIENLLLIAA